MDYIQFLTIMGTLLAGFSFMYREFKAEITNVKTEIRSFEKEVREDIRIQNNRSDQLYTMFIELLKETRKS